MASKLEAKTVLSVAAASAEAPSGPGLAAEPWSPEKVKELQAAGRPVLLFENEWSISWATEHNRGLELSDTASRVWAVD